MAIGADELAEMRDALIRARASGTLSVRFADGRQVTYRDGDDIAAAIADLEARIRSISPRRPRTVRFSVSKGM